MALFQRVTRLIELKDGVSGLATLDVMWPGLAWAVTTVRSSAVSQRGMSCGWHGLGREDSAIVRARRTLRPFLDAAERAADLIAEDLKEQ